MSKKEDLLPIEHHEMYLSIAKKEYREILKLKRKIKETINSSSQDIIVYKDGEDEITEREAAEQQVIPLEIDIDERCIVVIIFCALTLEAFINSYGITNLSKKYFTDYIDRLSLQAKWVLIPKLTVGQGFEKEIKLLERFGKLIKMRNKLTHYKTRYFNFNESDRGSMLQYGITEAKFSLLVVRDMVMKLHEIDGRARTGWLEY